MEPKKSFAETTKELRGATWEISALSITDLTTQELEAKLEALEVSVLDRLRQNLYVTDGEFQLDDIKSMLEGILNGCSDMQLSHTIGTVEALFKSIGIGLDSKRAVLLARKFHEQTGIGEMIGITGFLSNLNYLNCSLTMNDVVSNYLQLYKSLISQVAAHTPVCTQSFNIHYRSFGSQNGSYQITLDGRHLVYHNPYLKVDTPVVGMLIENSKKSRRYVRMLKSTVRDSYFSVYSAIRWANPEELKRPHGRSISNRIQVRPVSTTAEAIEAVCKPAVLEFDGLQSARTETHTMEVCVLMFAMNIDVLRTDHLHIREDFAKEAIAKGDHPIAASLQLMCGLNGSNQIISGPNLYSTSGVRTEMVSASISMLQVVSQLGVFSVCKHL